MNQALHGFSGVSLAVALAAGVIAAGAGCGSSGGGSGRGFMQTNLVANTAGDAKLTDPNLLNSWGIAHSPMGPWWVSDNHSGKSTVYDGQGNPTMVNGQPLVVTIPPPPGSPPGATAAPTGIVFNATADFVITEGETSAPALFISATEDGTVSAWRQNLADPFTAVLEVDNSGDGAIFKGLAIGANAAGDNRLYASNFHAGTVEVFDASFAPVTLASGAFTDPGIPSGFAPFGIQNADGSLFVTYAKQNDEKADDVHGPGNGYVDVFDMDGRLLHRFASKGPLNSPWAIVRAPGSFGRFGGALLIGNFGDGKVNAFDPTNGSFLGSLNRRGGGPLVISGLWGLAFGNGSGAGSAGTLYFAAGPNDEADGLFGMVVPVPSPTPTSG
jgi:uncharacterized protein (TIGR03118 family)